MLLYCTARVVLCEQQNADEMAKTVSTMCDGVFPSNKEMLYLPIPMNCRGMELLAFATNGTIYFCVHQISVELWRLYDTPRVSIQKKILDLHIQLTNCTKEQIKMLRKAGIIENFRATMIALRDTERLYDALEQSRRKRGLLKHALKAKSNPSQRPLRMEEKRARRLKAKVKPLVCKEPTRVANNCEQSANYDEKCALNGEYDSDSYVEEDGELLVVQDVEQAEALGGEHWIEVVSNDIQVAGESARQKRNCIPLNPMDHIPIENHQHMTDRLGSPQSTEGSDHPLLQSPKSIVSSNRSVSRLSSPVFEASELEERASVHSHNSRTRSTSTSPGRLPSVTPERFLYLDVESDSELSVFSGETHSTAALNSTTHSQSSGATKTVGSSVGVRTPTPIRLIHLAQVKAPPHSIKYLPPEPPTSLIVSIPVSRQASSRKRRQLALSSFATKKRANSRTSSTSSEGNNNLTEMMGKKYPQKGRNLKGAPRGTNKKLKRVTSVEGKTSKTRRKNSSLSSDTQAGVPMDIGTDGAKGPTCTTLVGTNCNNSNSKVQAVSRMQTKTEAIFPVQEDDQLSVASSSTNSNKSSKVNSGRSRTSKLTRNGGILDAASIKSTFSLQNLFSFYDPLKLVVKDGELLPEQSLSLKDFDRQSIPSGHPVFKWTPGQPVKGMKRKKRKNGE